MKRSGLKVFAPATVANVAVGFDILGFAVEDIGDDVIIREGKSPGLKITSIHNNPDLSKNIEENTAGYAALQLLKSLGEEDMPIEMELIKNMGIGTGLGSSAASAVAGVFAVNEFLGKPYKKEELLGFATMAEQLADGSYHADNVAPSLLGGIVLLRDNESLDFVKLPVPVGLKCVLIYPLVEILTAEARDLLTEKITMKQHVQQSGNLAAFIASLYKSDFELLSRSLNDCIVEPQRSKLIPHFSEAKEAALKEGALGFSISGAGPSMFALCSNTVIAENVVDSVMGLYSEKEIDCNYYISDINQEGAKNLLMRFVSTEDPGDIVGLEQAILSPIPSGGGLYVPAKIPHLGPDFFDQFLNRSFPDNSFDIAVKLFGDDVDHSELYNICRSALNFPVPLVKLDDNLYVLELFHGPTMAFKDFGARFMAGLTSHIYKSREGKLTVLVATSGDTGGAVANAFKGISNINVIILYPEDRITPLQEKQINVTGNNIIPFKISGNFDDCQRLVKNSFSDPELSKKYNFISANSINVARLLPQCFYYFEAVKQLNSFKENIFVVPSGNLGNLCAGLISNIMGLEVGHFVAAMNHNDSFTNYINTGEYRVKPSRPSHSNAMDVGDPGNFKRVLHLTGSTWNMRTNKMRSYSISDSETLTTIKYIYTNYNYVADPHTAVGLSAALKNLKQFNDKTHIILSAASPLKFENTIRLAIPGYTPGEIKLPEYDIRPTICSKGFNEFKQKLLMV